MQKIYMAVKEWVAALLRWSERYTKTDMLYIAKGGFWLSIGKVSGAVFGLILSIGYANLLPAEAFGIYQFVLSAAAVVTAFTLTGMNIPLSRAAARGLDGSLRAAARIHLKWSIGIAIAGLAAALYYFANDNQVLAVSMLIVGAFAPFLETFRLYSPFLTGKQAFRLNTTIGIGRKLMWMVILFTTLFLTDNPVIIVFAYFASQTISLGLIYREVSKRHGQGTGEIDRLSFSFSKHLSFLNILGRVAGNLDKILVFHYLGAVQLAVYTFAMLPVQQLRIPNQIVSTLSFSKMSKQDIGTLRQSVPRKTFLLFLLFAALASMYVVAAPYIYAFLFPQYMESVLFSQVLAIGLLFIPVSLLKNAFSAHLRKREMYIIKIVTLVTRIGLIITLLPLYGLWGAVAASLATGAVNALLSIVLFFRLRKKI